MSFGIRSIRILGLIYPGETCHGPVQLGGEAIWKDGILKFLRLQIYNVGFHSRHANGNCPYAIAEDQLAALLRNLLANLPGAPLCHYVEL